MKPIKLFEWKPAQPRRTKIVSPFFKPSPVIKNKTSNLIFGFDMPKRPLKIKGDRAFTWNQAKKKYPKLSPFGDADHDGVQNWLDCRPFDISRQAVRTKKPKWIKTGWDTGPRFQDIRGLENKEDVVWIDKWSPGNYAVIKGKELPTKGMKVKYKEEETIGNVGTKKEARKMMRDYMEERLTKSDKQNITTPEEEEEEDEEDLEEMERERREEYGLPSSEEEYEMGGGSSIIKEDKNKGIALIRFHDSYSPPSEAADTFEIRMRGKEEPLWSGGITHTAEFLGEGGKLSDADEYAYGEAGEEFERISKEKEPKKFFVGVAEPWPGNEGLQYDVEENKDLLSPDLMGGKKYPLSSIEAGTKKEALKKYKEENPQLKESEIKEEWIEEGD